MNFFTEDNLYINRDVKSIIYKYLDEKEFKFHSALTKNLKMMFGNTYSKDKYISELNFECIEFDEYKKGIILTSCTCYHFRKGYCDEMNYDYSFNNHIFFTYYYPDYSINVILKYLYNYQGISKSTYIKISL